MKQSPTKRQNSYQKVLEDSLEQTVEKLDNNEAKKQKELEGVSKKLDLDEGNEEGEG